MVLDGKIYIMGGIGDGDVELDTVEAYDPQADSWQQVASMPHPAFLHSAAAMGGKIYVTGGFELSQTNSTSSVYEYDPQADAWTQRASMGNARRNHASAAVGGKLYVFGGSNHGCLNSVEVYDPASDSWVQGLSLTSKRACLMAVAV